MREGILDWKEIDSLRSRNYGVRRGSRKREERERERIRTQRRGATAPLDTLLSYSLVTNVCLRIERNLQVLLEEGFVSQHVREGVDGVRVAEVAAGDRHGGDTSQVVITMRKFVMPYLEDQTRTAISCAESNS
ncbi:hypothetical protein EVAR_76094_1 [Eumeta japonica]|uniref:Uncharacterized protein n=1 Tax=Eumeta variegata TaxID=151549 RepID=A0A4C1W3A3_EUMVA|nr:hypothetical protein EVAR_76094_1 [Eumeta japonica]